MTGEKYIKIIREIILTWLIDMKKKHSWDFSILRTSFNGFLTFVSSPLISIFFFQKGFFFAICTLVTHRFLFILLIFTLTTDYWVRERVLMRMISDYIISISYSASAQLLSSRSSGSDQLGFSWVSADDIISKNNPRARKSSPLAPKQFSSALPNQFRRRRTLWPGWPYWIFWFCFEMAKKINQNHYPVSQKNLIDLIFNRQETIFK